MSSHTSSVAQFMGVSDVARYVGVTNRTVLRWMENDTFVPSVRTPSGRVLFERSAVVAYFERQAV